MSGMHRSPVTPEQRAMIAELLPQVLSLRDIGAILELSRSEVRQEADPLIKLMRLQGTLPPCDCGQPRFHHGNCSAKRIGAAQPDKMQLMKRAMILALIMTGERYEVIAETLGMGPKSIDKYCRYLSPEQRAERKALEAERGRQPGSLQRKSHRYSDETVAMAAKMLVEGDSYGVVSAATDVPEKRLHAWRNRLLTDEQRAARTEAIGRRDDRQRTMRHRGGVDAPCHQ